MAFIFCRKNSCGKTWYVGYYVNGEFVRKKIGRSKVVAEKARGDIEAKLEIRCLPRYAGLKIRRGLNFPNFFA